MQGGENIGERIRHLREAAGMTQARLGEIAGCNQQTVDRIEKGFTSRSKHLPAILDALDIDETEHHALGLEIRLARKGAGLSQAEVAAHLGVSSQAVSQWESGATAPTSENLIAMSTLFSAPLGMGAERSADADRIARVREAERLRMIAQDLKAKAADLEAMAARLERG